MTSNKIIIIVIIYYYSFPLCLCLERLSYLELIGIVLFSFGKLWHIQSTILELERAIKSSF